MTEGNVEKLPEKVRKIKQIHMKKTGSRPNSDRLNVANRHVSSVVMPNCAVWLQQREKKKYKVFYKPNQYVRLVFCFWFLKRPMNEKKNICCLKRKIKGIFLCSMTFLIFRINPYLMRRESPWTNVLNCIINSNRAIRFTYRLILWGKSITTLSN